VDGARAQGRAGAGTDAPVGVVQSGGGWMYDEFAHGAGVQNLGLEDKVPEAPSTEERNSILDLFRR
jgi:penicillin-binding protein 1A